MFAWWHRLKERVGGWFRREPAPARFEEGSKFSAHGWSSSAPAVWPSRDYVVYVPKGAPRFRRSPLLVLLHGCKQTADEIARGTRIAEFADREGTVILLPTQKGSANPWRCWNWFDPRTSRGDGEAAIVAAQIRSVRRRYRIDRKRVHVAGMSSGGALAAILGVRFPHLVSAVAVHSGIACGAARSGMTAVNVLKRGPEQDVEAIATTARKEALPSEIRVPLLAIQGDRDEVVPPAHATALVRQYLALNGDDPARAPDAEARIPHPDGREEIVRDWRRDGRLIVRYVEVQGLGHAWSGGDATLDFNDAGPPDATALLGTFFADALSSRPEGAKRRWRFWGMNHFTVLTDDVPGTVEFYTQFVGLADGPRPDLGFPGAWMYAGDDAILHIVGGKAREQLRAGVIDHMAFTARGLADTIALLTAYNIEHVCRQQVGTRLWQVFFHDPNGARVELDFASDEVRK